MDRGRRRCVSVGVGFEGARGTGRGERGTRGLRRPIRSLGANRVDGVAHLEGARPAHGLRGPERGGARGLGLQVELVCERVSRERGPPDTILRRERWRVRVRGRKNPILVRSGGRGAFAARGLERNGRPRPSRAFEKWRSSRPVRIAIEPRGWRFGTSPVPSSPEIDPPPRGALSAIRVVCGIAVCSPPPAFCPCVPAQRAACLPRWEPWSRATPASFSGAVLNPPTFGVPAPVALAQELRFPDCLFWLVSRTTSTFAGVSPASSETTQG